MTQADIVVIVGPNNSGKSASLRAIRDKVSDSARQNPVVTSLKLSHAGTAPDVVQWLENTTRINRENSPGNPMYQLFGTSVYHSNVSSHWSSSNLSQLSRFFCHLLTADERLQAANPAPAIALIREPLSHPIHFLQRDDALESQISLKFRQAFGVDLILHRNAGNQVPLYTGERPSLKEGQDRISRDYIVELEKLPTLQTQGDGMRSFVGVLLHTSVGHESILLIDEPEAFLHPPQARQL
ncbi:MAG: AAA family ATPase, partial [Nitrososphaerales archaeon]